MRTALLLAALLLSLPAAAATPADDAFRTSYAREARGDTAGALAALEPIVATPLNGYVLELRRGWLLYLAGRLPDAAKAYERAIALEPKALEPRHGILLPLLADRRFAEAKKHADAALAIAPQDFTALSKLGYIEYSLLRYEPAEAAYRRALALHPGSVDLRAGLGWALLRQRRLPEAREQLERVLAVAPDHASAKEGLAAIP